MGLMLKRNTDLFNRIPAFKYYVLSTEFRGVVRNSDAQQVGGEVLLPEGLEVDVVGRLELALLEDRFLREAREALAHVARELAVLQGRLVQRRFDEREAHEGVVVVARHGVQHARG